YEDAIKSGFGDVFIKQGRYREAAKAYLESLQLSQHFNKGFEAKKIIYGKLSKTYELMGDYKSALKYHTFFAQYSDSLNKKEKYEQLINVEKKYETEKKENEIIQLQAKQELTDVQLRKNKQLKQLAFITASLLLIFAFFVLMKYLDKLKSNQLLKLKNQQIEESEQELRRLNAAKNKFFSIIAHDLKNPLHNVMGYSYLLSKDYDNFSEKERKKFAADINQSTNNIFRLLQNLLEWAKTQTGALNFSPMEIEFKRILENSFSVLRPLAQQKSIEVKFSLTDDLKLYADPQMIETVLRNLINNAIKFTPENGSIEISAQSAGDYVRVNITDSGIGIAGEDVENLFRIDSKVKRKGTNNEDGSGLGLIICKEFIDKNNGTISVTSTPGEGSSFSFTLPAKAIA
ncbi:MAG: tetratricopeptide repeat-containing sensor histidine kinase, partial [Prolixibacteraceae bacterium]|nr:tetratricopeptide repeat-containing sensor histidine kinase [Prolixibacteraceae bacterium]